MLSFIKKLFGSKQTAPASAPYKVEAVAPKVAVSISGQY
jgi:hypothetical protein